MLSLFYSPEEEREYAGEARTFFEKEIRPYVESMDRKNQYPFDLLNKLARQRYIGPRFPPGTGEAEKPWSMRRSLTKSPGPSPMPWLAPAAFPTT